MNTDTIDKWLQKLSAKKPWIENNSNKVNAGNIKKTATDPSIPCAEPLRHYGVKYNHNEETNITKILPKVEIIKMT